MTKMTNQEQMAFANELYERSKDDGALIAGSEIRQLYGYFVEASQEIERLSDVLWKYKEGELQP